MENHDHHNGTLGAIFAVLGYFWAISEQYLPDPGHLIPAIITALCCATVGFFTTKFLGWGLNKISTLYTNIVIRLFKKK